MFRTLQTAPLLAIVFLAACSQTPTSPSRAALQADGSPAGSLSSWASQARSVVVSWECLTQGAGCAGNAGSWQGLAAVAEGMPAEAPGAPVNLTAQVTGSNLLLTWGAPAGGGSVATYVVEAGNAAGLSNVASFATGGTATILTAAGVPNGTYFVRVRARNADGTSGPSNEVTIVVGSSGGTSGGSCPAPGAPAGFAATASGNSVTLSWNPVAGALSYIIEAGSVSGAANLVSPDTGNTATSFTATAPNGTYYLRVRVRTACGVSGPSNEASLTVGGTATTPGTGTPGTTVTGRWVGLQASGDGATSTPNECGVERWDWQLDLVQSGTAVTGTLTQTTVVSGCDTTGHIKTMPFSGSINGTALTLTANISGNNRLDITATVSGTRMTGTALANGGAFGTSQVALNRQ